MAFAQHEDVSHFLLIILHTPIAIKIHGVPGRIQTSNESEHHILDSLQTLHFSFLDEVMIVRSSSEGSSILCA